MRVSSIFVSQQGEKLMAISSTDRRAKNVQIFVEKDAVETSFAKWAQPGHFSRTLAKGPKNNNLDLEFTCRCA